jgi:hypothetical protein
MRSMLWLRLLGLWFQRVWFFGFRVEWLWVFRFRFLGLWQLGEWFLGLWLEWFWVERFRLFW